MYSKRREVSTHAVLCPLTFQLPAMMGCRIFNSVVVLLEVGTLLLMMVLKAYALPQRAAVARRVVIFILGSFIADCRWRGVVNDDGL